MDAAKADVGRMKDDLGLESLVVTDPKDKPVVAPEVANTKEATSTRRTAVYVIPDACDNYLKKDLTLHGYMPSELDPQLIGRVAGGLLYHAHIGCNIPVESVEDVEVNDCVFGGAITKTLDKEEDTFVGYMMYKKGPHFDTVYNKDNPSIWLNPYDVYDIKALAWQMGNIAKRTGIVASETQLSETVHFAVQIVHPTWKNGKPQGLSDSPELQFASHQVTQTYPDYVHKVANPGGHHATNAIVAYIYVCADKAWGRGNAINIPGKGDLVPHSGTIVLDADGTMERFFDSRPSVDSKREYSQGSSRHVLQLRIPFLKV